MRFRRGSKKLRPLPEVSLSEKGTIIGRGMDWHGNLATVKDVLVFGTLVGDIESTCEVRVERSGRVRGRISAASVVVAGTVDGDVAAARGIEVEATGRVKGNLAARKVAMAQGSRVEGEVQTLKRTGVARGETFGRS